LHRKKQLSSPFEIRNKLAAFILVFFTLSWWSLSLLVFKNFYQPMEALNPSIVIIARALYYTSIIAFSIIASFIIKRIRRLLFLYYWMLMGTFFSLIPILLNRVDQLHLFFASVALGFAFGIGLPSCLAFFADMTNFENRGSLSGVVFLISSLIVAIIAIILSGTDFKITALVAGLWRVVGLILFVLLTPKKEDKAKAHVHTSFSSVFENRQFLLYFIPWCAFSLIEWFESPIRMNVFGEFATLAEIMGVALGGISAAVWGIFSDRVGRKIIVLYSFVSIGIAYATLSIMPTNILVWWFFAVIDAVAFGPIYIMFILTIWGDLSRQSERQKYYAIGTIPFFLAGILELVVRPYVASIRPEAAFSLASFFLFIAVIPLLFAPETLPEKTIKERELKDYIEKAKKVKEKYG
jgi:hypothetical protein